MFAGRPASFRDWKQERWYTKRPAEVEAAACALIRRRETRRGRIPGCVVPPELLVAEVGCKLEYFGDEDRLRYKLPPDVIGALKPFKRLILVYHPIEVVGREWHTIGEEIGHMVLHAKGVPPPDQMDLGIEHPSQTGPCGLFHRTVSSSYVDRDLEKPWMTREAGFFSACLQMPRDRYGPVAEKWLRKSLRALRAGREAGTVEERVTAVRPYARLIAENGWDAAAFSVFRPGMFDRDVIDNALDLLRTEHKGQVSKAAQRRRLVELGLVVDPSHLLRGSRGERLLPEFEFLFVSDGIREQA